MERDPPGLTESRQLTTLADALLQDLDVLIAMIREDTDSQVLRRAYVLHAIVYIEARLSGLKRWIAATHEALVEAGHRGIFSVAEHLFLLEQLPSLKRDDTIRTRRPDFQYLHRNIQYTFSAVARTWEVDWARPEGEWSIFNKAKEVRNGIAHAKTHDDLEVSDERLLLVEEAVNWFDQMRIELLALHDQKIADVKAGRDTYRN